MKFLQFTDLHLTEPGRLLGGRDPQVNFARALEHAMENNSDVEAIFLTGDLSETGNVADYRLLREMIADLSVPVHATIGNHDRRDTFLSVFPEHGNADGFVQSRAPLSEGVALMLDTHDTDMHAGSFCETRAAWLAAQLAQDDAPVWLFLHHHPVPTHEPYIDNIILRDRARLGAVIAPHRDRIRHIFFGHIHAPLAGSFHGIPVSASRGTNHAGWLNFPDDESGVAPALPQSYVVTITDGPAVTVHMVDYGALQIAAQLNPSDPARG